MLKASRPWKKREGKENDSNEIAKAIDEPVEHVQLAQLRGQETLQEIESYLKHEYVFHDPFLMHDMRKAIDRLQEAVEKGEKILVYGDYDVDGITSATILTELIDSMGGEVEAYLPNRFIDGYGPNLQVYRYYIKKGIKLIVTCDNGVQGFEAIEEAQKQGVDVILTDHHEIGDSLPKAYAVVHARHPEGHYPFGDLCGAGVALKMASAVMGEVPNEFLELAALGTIADVVSLTDENRTIVYEGLRQLRQTGRVGLQELFKLTNIDPNTITEETIGFTIAPHLNALGRMDDANPGVKLLMTFDEEEAKELAELVVKTNQERKEAVANMLISVEEKLKALSTLPNFIILADENWPEGVLGIVASQIVERYQRPTILLTHKVEDHLYKGSGRSINGINLFDLLQASKKHALKSGGHEMAAGMTIQEDHYDLWKKSMEEALENQASEIKDQPLHYDEESHFSQLTLEKIKDLMNLGPFGTDNQPFRFLIQKALVTTSEAIGQDKKTLRLQVQQDNQKLQMIGFRLGKLADRLKIGREVDLIVEYHINHWNGRESLQGRIIDLKQDGKALMDWRNNHDASSLSQHQDATFLFETREFFKKMTPFLPEQANIHFLEDEDQSSQIEDVVIMEAPRNMAKLEDFISTHEVQNLYWMAFPYQRSQTMNSAPSRQELAKVYTYLRQHPVLKIKGKFGALSAYLAFQPERLKLLLGIFVDLKEIKWKDDEIQFTPTGHQIDFKKSLTYQEWMSQAVSQQFSIDRLEKLLFKKEKEQ